MDDNLLYSFLCGETSPDEEKAILEWLRSDEANLKYLTDLYAVNHEADRLGRGRDINSMLSGLHAVENQIKKRERKGLNKWLRFAGITSAAAAIAAVFLLRPEITNEGKQFSYFNPDSTAITVTLPDYSTVMLGSNTSISCGKSFLGGKRTVRLNGEAFFDVSHDAAAPFIVETSRMKVKVYGTRFNVRSLDSEPFSEVTLVEGSVSLQNAKGENLILLTPGQQVRYSHTEKFVQVKEIPVRNILQERYGFISLQDMTITDILGEIGRIYNVSLSSGYDDKGALFTVNFPQGADVSSVVKTVSMMTKCEITVNGKSK